MPESIEDLTPSPGEQPPPKRNRITRYAIAACILLSGIVIGYFIREIITLMTARHTISINSASWSPEPLSTAFTQAAEKVRPSVVSIRVIRINDRASLGLQGMGSGVIVSKDGFIITNLHVIRQASRLVVRLADETEFDAIVIGIDTETDLSVLKIDAGHTLQAAVIGDPDRMKVGDWALAIGAPFGLEQTVTAGIISAKNRVAGKTSSPFQRFIQTDASMNPGNSGGPLVNLSGEVIGINTQIATEKGTNSGVGIGFSLPATTAVDVFNQIVTYGRVMRGFLGVIPRELTPQLARQNGVTEMSGVLVEDLTSADSPAARGGIRSGDIIITIGGDRVASPQEFMSKIASLEVGAAVEIGFVRDGRQLTARIMIEERKRTGEDSQFQLSTQDDPKTSPPPKPGIGLTVITLTPDRARKAGLQNKNGVLVTGIEFGSLSQQSGITLNDVVTEINRINVRSKEEYYQLIGTLKRGDDVVIKLIRRNQSEGRRINRIVIITFTLL